MTEKRTKNNSRKTISELSEFDLETLIARQKEKLKVKQNNVQTVIEKNKLMVLEKELQKRNAGRVRL